jgi:hypothetical protein
MILLDSYLNSATIWELSANLTATDAAEAGAPPRQIAAERFGVQTELKIQEHNTHYSVSSISLPINLLA